MSPIGGGTHQDKERAMSKQAVGSALEAMQDDEVRDRFAAGDFGGIEWELDEYEQGLVQRAAAGYPEVLPFFTLVEHAQLIGLQGANPASVQLPAVQLPAVQLNGDWSVAFNYALTGQSQSQVG
jgi:hypothetical protein